MIMNKDEERDLTDLDIAIGGEPSPLEINLQPLLEFIWSVVACRCQRFADVGAGYDHHRVLVLNYLMISLIPKVRGRDKYSELPVP